MSRDNNPEFDFGRFEAEITEIARAQTLRAEALSHSERLWSKYRESNAALATRRRLIIAGGPNTAVPATHERMLIIPRPRGGVVAGVQQLRISRPFLPSSEGAEKRLDPRFAFLDIIFKQHVSHRVLLSEGEYSRYRNSQDIDVATRGEYVNYTVPADVSSEIKIGSAVLSDVPAIAREYVPEILSGNIGALQDLNAILENYEPSLQDNLSTGAK